MSNILDYIEWRGDLTLEQDAFCAVDALILSTIMYIEFEQLNVNLKSSVPVCLGDVGNQIAKQYNDEKLVIGRLIPKHVYSLLDVVSMSPRFQNMKLSHYVNQIDEIAEKQFSAMVIQPGDGTIFVTFRGTDDTIIGWKEDFNMCFKSPVPAQLQAVDYLDSIAGDFDMDIRIGGHSKGGNLSVFSAAFCKKGLENRILDIYDFDGPGFTKDVLTQMTKNDVFQRIHSIVPESSVVGMLMEHEYPFDVVASSSSGIFRHDPFSWEVKGKEFVPVDDISARAYKLDHTLRDFLSTYDADQKKELIDTIFGILLQTGAKTLSDLSIKDMPAMIKSIRDEESENKQVILQALKLFIQSAHLQREDLKKIEKQEQALLENRLPSQD